MLLMSICLVVVAVGGYLLYQHIRGNAATPTRTVVAPSGPISNPPVLTAVADPVASFNSFLKKFFDAAALKAHADAQKGFLSYSFDPTRASTDVTKTDSLVSPYVGKLKLSVWDGGDSHEVDIEFQLISGKWTVLTVTSSEEVTEYQKVGTKVVAGIAVDDQARVKRTKDDSDEMKTVVQKIVQAIP